MSGFSQPLSGSSRSNRNRSVTAVLGPTNTGKTHLAIERMLGHETGMIGLPLRLLAREVYTKIAGRIGEAAVALVTGEEKILPPDPRYWVCTVEAMPLDTDAAFVAIDEVQLAGDLERGHVFTDRILNLRGQQETLLLGAATMRGILERIVPGINIITRPRMSVLAYSGQKKITRLPPRSAIVAFSSDEVYGIAELVRRQRGGAAVVMGALSPRTRNAQVALYQSGDVDFLIATDAIGMGLNLDVDHVAFASDRKFDGYQYRALTPAELGQISGRAGRHMKDGTFGVTGRVDPFPDDVVDALESHAFQPVSILQWRERNLDTSSVDALRASLDTVPGIQGLTRAPAASDIVALDHAMKDDEVLGLATGSERVALLWTVCQLPDYRKIAPANHYELIHAIFTQIARSGHVDPDWFDTQVKQCANTNGDIDALANRIAHIRTWTYLANRPDWLADAETWRENTRAIEDTLSDALHDRLIQRFVDRRTSVLMKRLRENAMLEADINDAGDIVVEGEHIGHLEGFRFTPASRGDSAEAKAVRAAAMKALAEEIGRRADRMAAADNAAFVLAAGKTIRWQGAAVAKLAASEDPLKPRVIPLADEHLTGPALEKVQKRLDTWIAAHVEGALKPLLDLREAADLTGIARGVAFRLVESFGNIARTEIGEDIRKLDQETRAVMRRYGIRFGAYTIYVPALLKPAPSQLLAELWALAQPEDDVPGLQEIPQLSASGRTSVPVDPAFAPELYRIVGYRVCGARAVRIDILERLADLIRPLIAWRASEAQPTPPDGAIERGGGFTVTVAMTSLLGCSGDDFAGILKTLGYRVQRVPRPAPPAPDRVTAPDTPLKNGSAETATDALPDGQATHDGPEHGAADTIAATDAVTTSNGFDALPDASAEAAVDGPAVSSQEPTEPQETETVLSSDTGPVDEPIAAAVAVSDGPEADAVAPPATDGQGTSSEAGTDAGEADAADGRDATSGEDEAPDFIEIWRPGGDRQRNARSRSKGRTGKPQGAGQGPRRTSGKSGGRGERDQERRPSGDKGGKRPPRKDNQAGRRPRPEKPLDPDSPFAALAALKASMEKDEK